MGQEEEETAELLATIERDHVAMKTWFKKNSSCENLKSQYGSYPDFWRDVISWPGYKETRKAYLRHLAQSEKQESSDKALIKDGPIPRKKKRRSRWSSQPPEDLKDKVNSTERKAKRKSRWDRLGDTSSGTNATNHNAAVPVPAIKPTAATGILGLLPGMPAGMTAQQLTNLSQIQTRLKRVNHKLATLDIDAIRVDNLPRDHPDRSPSPPPIYGMDGKRKNTRAVRWRERYTQERQDCLELMMDLNPALRPPGFVKRKRTNKVYVPVKEHPTYNFIGLIIGPRGKTQKEMESKTGCKIAIRGKGSVKEGARGRRDGKPMEGDNEPLHVVITGEDQASVDKATKMVEDMLVVIDDEKNVHKQQQLRELALLNGTLKEEEFCNICAEKGHRTFECPKRFSLNKPTLSIKCAICGDTSHVTSDCTMKPKDVREDEQKQLDSDYQNFMDELDGKAPKSATALSTTQCIPVPTSTSVIPAVAAATTATAPVLPPASTTGIPGMPPAVGTTATTTLPPPGYPPTTYPAVPLPGQPGIATTIVPPTMLGAATAPLPTASYQAPAYGQNSYYQYPPGTTAYPNTAYNYAAPPPNVPPPNAAPAVPGQTNPNYSEDTSGWDYRSYYGTADYTGGDGAGAGGFNWWE